MYPEGTHFIVYALLTGLGLVAGVITLKMTNYPSRHNGTSVMSLLPLLAVGVIIGAKIPVIISYGWHREFLWTGKSYFGALLGAFLVLNIYKVYMSQKGNFGDRFVIPLCISAGIGKIGCFFNGCCGGTATDCFLGVINRNGVNTHPTQLYESAFEFTCAGFFIFLYKRNMIAGSHFPLYMLIYMSFRFLIEFIRTEPRLSLGMTIYQWMALLFVPIFSIILYGRIANAK